ncbi:MAG: hypothetical protein LBQ71_01720, partial [Hungatella sp.]|nr:hypothetical protein [Hungatella sp.]
MSGKRSVTLAFCRRRHCGYVDKAAAFRSVGKTVYNYLIATSSDCYERFSPCFVGCLVHISM